MSTETGTNMLAFWRRLAAQSVLQCPVCHGSLDIAEPRFQCLSCAAIFPVESGVPLLLRPDEIISIPDRVMEVFNVPPIYKDRVETALGPLTKYKTHSHPEFANIFARFDATEVQAPSIPLQAEEIAASIDKLECLSPYFPDQLRSDAAEFRSIRLRNNSDRILFTDARNPLYLSYRIFDLNGEPVAFEAERTPLPCPFRPGSELTVPVMVRLPAGVTGKFTVRFYFLLAGGTRSDIAAGDGAPARPAPGSIASWRARLRRRYPARPAVNPTAPVQWFDKTPLATMAVTATDRKTEFPATYRDRLQDFTVAQDVGLADDFLSDVIDKLRSAGIAEPRILEIGAGVYPISLRTCGEPSSVVVSDISLVMQTLAAIMHMNNPAVIGRRAAFASFDMMHPPFGPGSFDVICISAALHHIPSPHEFLKRLAPLLSAEGRFVAVREPCLVNPTEPAYISELSNGFNEQMFELSEWQEIIAIGGFVLDRAVVDFECSLKFSARLRSLPEAA